MATITDSDLPMELMILGAEQQFSGNFLCTLGVNLIPQKLY